MICSNCGYENNTDDALSCNLCGKVFRKEQKKDEEVRETNKQPESKLKKFYGEMKKGWIRDSKLDPGGTGIIGLGNTIINLIKLIKESKGNEKIQHILLIPTLIIAVVIGFILDHKFDISRKVYTPGSGYGFWWLIICCIWVFVYWISIILYRKITSFLDSKQKRRKKK